MHPALLLPASYRDAVLALPGLVGYWPLGERSGTVARDLMGLNHGTYVGSPTLGAPGPLAGDPSTAVTFANGKYVTLASEATLPMGATPRSFGFWMNENATLNQALLFYGTVVSTKLCYLYIASNGVLVSYSGVSGVNISPAAFKTTGWVDGVAVYNGSSWTTYVNGAWSAGPVAQTLATEAGGTAMLAYEGSTFYLNGSLAHPFLVARAITPGEIADLYRIGMGR